MRYLYADVIVARGLDLFARTQTPVFTGKTTLTLDPLENVVVDHTEVWDQAPSEIVQNLKFFDKSFDPPGFSD